MSADSVADATPVAASAAAADSDAPAPAPASPFVISDEDQRELDRQARLARKRAQDRVYRQNRKDEKAKAAASSSRKPAGTAAAKTKHEAAADKSLAPESSSPKRVKRAHPAASASAAGADDDDDSATPGVSSPHPSPSVWSVLADLVFLPRFLALVHSQLATTRTAHINFHMLASAFRQKLVEGGWQRDQHYTLHGPMEAMLSEAKDDSSSAAAAAASSAPPAGVYLLKSKRAVSDFTPSVCQRLWSIIAYQRDSSPQAAVEMLQAGARHRRLEDRCRELRVPIMVGGKPTAPPLGATLKIERMFGLPKGADIGIKAAAPVPAAAAAATAAASAAAAAPSSAASAAASVPPPADDDDSDVEDTFEFWPGVYGDSLHGPQLRLDGSTVQRWARGQHVHVPPVAQDPTAKCHAHGLPLVSPAAAVGITDPAQVALINQLSSRASLVSQVNQLRATFRTDVSRGPVHVDWGTGDWIAELMSPRDIANKAAASMVPTSMLAKAETTVAQWISPADDCNLLEGVCDWIQRQPLPTRASFAQVPGGFSTPTISVLLPRTVSAWLEIRHAIAATHFPVGFLRRRWWLLCGESSRFEAQQRAALAEAKATNTELPPITNPSLAALSAQVVNITDLLSQRIAQFMTEHAHSNDGSTQAQAATTQEHPLADNEAAAPAAQPDQTTAITAATNVVAPPDAAPAEASAPSAAPAAVTDAPQAMELDGQNDSALPALS